MKKYFFVLICCMIHSLVFADGSSWETNIKRSKDPVEIDIVSTVDSITNTVVVSGLTDFVYPSGETVVSQEYSASQKFGLAVMDIHDLRVLQGQSFRVESAVTMASGATFALVQITSGATLETWLQIGMDAKADFTYQLYLEPSGVTGTALNVASRNPHYQFLGGRRAEFKMYSSPTYTATGPVIRTKYLGTWGIPYRSEWTILSPNQTLMYIFTNTSGSTNTINFTAWIEELQDGVEE